MAGSRSTAIEQARRLAKELQKDVYVVYVPEYREYKPASNNDRCTFYAGCPIECLVSPDGTVER